MAAAGLGCSPRPYTLGLTMEGAAVVLVMELIQGRHFDKVTSARPTCMLAHGQAHASASLSATGMTATCMTLAA